MYIYICIYVYIYTSLGTLVPNSRAMRLMVIILTDDALKHTCVWPLG